MKKLVLILITILAVELSAETGVQEGLRILKNAKEIYQYDRKTKLCSLVEDKNSAIDMWDYNSKAMIDISYVGLKVQHSLIEIKNRNGTSSNVMIHYILGNGITQMYMVNDKDYCDFTLFMEFNNYMKDYGNPNEGR